MIYLPDQGYFEFFAHTSYKGSSNLSQFPVVHSVFKDIALNPMPRRRLRNIMYMLKMILTGASLILHLMYATVTQSNTEHVTGGMLGKFISQIFFQGIKYNILFILVNIICNL